MNNNFITGSILLVVICFVFGLAFLITGIYGIRKNNRIINSKDYIKLKAKISYSDNLLKARVPFVIFEYDGKNIVKMADSAKYKEGEEVYIYYNPNIKDNCIRIEGAISNAPYFFSIIISLLFWGTIFVMIFPELFI